MSHCISGTAIVPFWSPFFCISFNRALQSCGIAAKRCGNLAEDVRLPSTVSELLDMILCPKVAISWNKRTAIRTPFLLTWKVHQIFYLVAVYLVFGLKHRNTRIEQHLGGCRGRRTHLVQHIMGGTPLHWRAQRCPKGSHQPPAEGDLPSVLILPLNHRKTGRITKIRVFFHKCLSRRANPS